MNPEKENDFYRLIKEAVTSLKTIADTLKELKDIYKIEIDLKLKQDYYKN